MILKREMMMRTQPYILLQILREFDLNSTFIFKIIHGPDSTCQDLQEWMG